MINSDNFSMFMESSSFVDFKSISTGISLSEIDMENMTRDMKGIFNGVYRGTITKDVIENLDSSMYKLINKYKVNRNVSKIDASYVNYTKNLYNIILSSLGSENIGSEKPEIKSTIFGISSKYTSNKILEQFGFYTLLTTIKILSLSSDSKSVFIFLENMKKNIDNKSSIRHNLYLLTYGLIRVKDNVSKYVSSGSREEGLDINFLLNILIVYTVLFISINS